MTTTDIYCKHEMVRADCVDCRPGKPRGFTGNPDLHQVAHGPEAQAASWAPSWVPGTASELGPWVTASFGGECASCRCRILPGQQIRSDSEAGGWVCGTCGER